MRKAIVWCVLGFWVLAACSGGDDDDDRANDDDVVDDDDVTVDDDDDDDDIDDGPLLENLHIAYLEDPSNGMGVSWKRESPMANGRVAFGPSPDALDQTAIPEVEIFEGQYQADLTSEFEMRTTYIYKARLEGLQPDSSYSYRVEDDLRESEIYTFTTAPESGESVPVEFIVMGDNRGPIQATPSPHYPLLLELVEKESYEFILTTGDMTYISYQSEWDTYFQDGAGLIEDKPWLVSQGNHDATLADSFMRNFQLPLEGKTWYSADYANIHFVALDTEDPYMNDENSEQIAWLEADLSANDSDWIIAYFHKAAYNSSDSHGSIRKVQDAFVEIFDRHGVDVVYMGHDHNYDRTHFLKGRSEDLPENDLPHGGGRMPAEICETACAEGTMYVTAGGAGAPLYDVLETLLPFTAVAEKSHHYIKVTIDGDQYEHSVYDMDGNVIDRFEFTRLNPR